MTRRTNAQISQDNYCKQVDQYNWFLLDTDTNKIVVGYELKEDCLQEQIDNDSKSYTKVISKRHCAKLNININEILTAWKQA